MQPSTVYIRVFKKKPKFCLAEVPSCFFVSLQFRKLISAGTIMEQQKIQPSQDAVKAFES